MSGNGSLVTHCATCRRPLGVRAFVSLGRIGAHVECEWCFSGTERPPQPELIMDTFAPPPVEPAARSLDKILDGIGRLGE